MSIGAVDRESVYIVELTLDTLWLLWGALGLPFAVFWGPFGHLAMCLGRLSAPFDSLWLPWGALGLPLGVLGHLWDNF